MASEFGTRRTGEIERATACVGDLLTALETLANVRDAEALCMQLADAARELTFADHAMLWLDQGSEPADVEAWAGQACIADRTPVVIVDVASDPRVPPALVCDEVRALVAVPLAANRALGALCTVWYRPHEAYDDELRMLLALSRCAALALENLRAEQELEARVLARTRDLQRAHDAAHELALTDHLTGLCNRRGFYLLAEQGLRHASRRDKPCVLLFMDLDGLKDVNDAHGHEAGDSLLSSAGVVLRETFRDSDVLGRTGGDEFCVLALDSDSGAAVRARLVDHIERYNRERRSAHRLAASIGVVEVPSGSHEKLDVLLVCADQAMYREKRSRPPGARSLPPQPPANAGPPMYARQAPPTGR